MTEFRVNSFTVCEPISGLSPETSGVIKYETIAPNKSFPVQVINIETPKIPLSGTLTKRGADVLKLIAQGLTYKEVSARLNISYETAKTHGDNVMRIFNAPSSEQAVYQAARYGILSLAEFTKNLNIERIRELSPKEKQVLEEFTSEEGVCTSKELAKKLGNSDQTIKNHLTNIFRKLNVESRVQAGLAYMAAKSVGLDNLPKMDSFEFYRKRVSELKKQGYGPNQISQIIGRKRFNSRT